MSTPVDLNIVMPYGVTVAGDNTRYAKIPKEHPKRLNESRLAVPPGPVRVSASWRDNDSPIDVNLYNGRSYVRNLATIPAGGVDPCAARRTRRRLHPNAGNVQHPRRHYRDTRNLPAQLRVARRAGAVV